jgi:DNA-binding NarL/FixJ family response regulator
MEDAQRGETRIRVLVADDHQFLLDRVVAILAHEFTVIGTVPDGIQLLAAEAALHPDVVVVDISMPGMTGIEAMERIRRRGSHAALVCLTAHDEDEVLEAALEAGALGYVNKTCVAHDLVPAIHAAVEGRRVISRARLAAT